MIKPSPFIASVTPGVEFDSDLHIAFGDLFLEKCMSGVEKEYEAVTKGAGLPDRGDQGWIKITGTGMGRLDLGSYFDSPIDIYKGESEVYIGLDRRAVRSFISFCESDHGNEELTVTDFTHDTVRMAVMGPDSRKLLEALDVPSDKLVNVGDYYHGEIILEPVIFCRSDFAGPHGYDLNIPMEPFNMILAAICSWGVRLDLNLLPIGWDCLERCKVESLYIT